MGNKMRIGPFHVAIYVALQLVVTFGAYISSNVSQQLYLYSLLVCQLFGYCYIYVLKNGRRAEITLGQVWARAIFRALNFVLVFGMLLGVINFIDGRNEFGVTFTYFILSIFQLLVIHAGYRCAVYNYWPNMRQILIIGAVMESVHGFVRYLGDSIGYRSSIGLSREGFWTLFYGRKFLFLFVFAGVLFVAATGGMRTAVATIIFYLLLLFLSSERIRKKARRRLVFMFLFLAVFGPIGITTLLSMDRGIFPPMMQVTLTRFESTFSSTPNNTIEDGRDVEWRSVNFEIDQNGVWLDHIFGRGVGFTYLNERTMQRETHIHLAVPRILSRYGYVGLIIFFGGALFISICSFLEVLKYNRFDLVKLGFLHSFVYFLFFGEDVFMSFWFLFGAALGSCFNSHFETNKTKRSPAIIKDKTVRSG
ncbi:MAG: hypothetical protein RID11_06060 [Roseovarius sp.]|jgi:hypothetical protein|uniref:hypothetical protein n=1 Tax=Roseovarius sp. TaxID=1486281 RepID=UPI0032ECCA72